MDVRQAIRADTPQLNELGPSVCANAVRGLCIAFDPPSWHCAMDEFLRLPDRRLFVAADGERIVGVLAVVACPALFARTSHVVRVVTLWVGQAHRGQGIARKLHAAAEEWARSVGAPVMFAGVPCNYDAHAELGDNASPADASRFYREQGYRPAEASLVKEIH
jgi:GNAT superfamily N-acetyltransferase